MRDVGVYPIHILSAWLGPVAAVSAFSAEDMSRLTMVFSMTQPLAGSTVYHVVRRKWQSCRLLDTVFRFRGGQCHSAYKPFVICKGADDAYKRLCVVTVVLVSSMWNGDTDYVLFQMGEKGQGVVRSCFLSANLWSLMVFLTHMYATGSWS